MTKSTNITFSPDTPRILEGATMAEMIAAYEALAWDDAGVVGFTPPTVKPEAFIPEDAPE